MVDEINKAIARIETHLESVDLTFADYQADTFQQCKAVAKHAQVSEWA